MTTDYRTFRAAPQALTVFPASAAAIPPLAARRRGLRKLAIGLAIALAREPAGELMAGLGASRGSQDQTLQRPVLDAHQTYVTVSDACF